MKIKKIVPYVLIPLFFCAFLFAAFLPIPTPEELKTIKVPFKRLKVANFGRHRQYYAVEIMDRDNTYSSMVLSKGRAEEIQNGFGPTSEATILFGSVFGVRDIYQIEGPRSRILLSYDETVEKRKQMRMGARICLPVALLLIGLSMYLRKQRADRERMEKKSEGNRERVDSGFGPDWRPGS